MLYQCCCLTGQVQARRWGRVGECLSWARNMRGGSGSWILWARRMHLGVDVGVSLGENKGVGDSVLNTGGEWLDLRQNR